MNQLIVPQVLELGLLRAKLENWDPARYDSIDVIQGRRKGQWTGAAYFEDLGVSDSVLPLEWNVIRSLTIQCVKEMYGAIPNNVRVFDLANRPTAASRALVIDMTGLAGLNAGKGAEALAQEAEELPPPSTLDFGHTIEVDGIELADKKLTLRVKLLKSVSCREKVLIHAFAGGEAMRIWDAKPAPPLCKWRAGELRAIVIQLPEGYRRNRGRLEIGFFDESDSAHNWPPLKLIDKGNAICVPPSNVSVPRETVALRSCTTSPG